MVAERGRILKVYNNVLHVAAEDAVILCKLRGRVKKGRSDMGLVPGDIVTFERISEGEGVIERIEARTNLLQRPRVANLTQIVGRGGIARPTSPRCEPFPRACGALGREKNCALREQDGSLHR